MPITPTQIQAAASAQSAAAHDISPQVRLIAGPGTGKSFAIEARVCWLLSQGMPPEEIYAVSFTRASSLDLRFRIQSYCIRNGQSSATQVRVSTLHSLALRTLRAAGLLTAYPSDPLVMDKWEVETIFDKEFQQVLGIGGTRSKDIRTYHEAFWNTGQWGPPNYIPPKPPKLPISASERINFQAFHGPRTQTYSCVLPGEIVRQCVGHMRAGTLDPVELLNLKQLIVDEYQDLNPMDLEFVDLIAANGATLFVAGDDDQSIYSFRYASPGGIQFFPNKYPTCGQHSLTGCFRCTPMVLGVGMSIINANPGTNRIPKNYLSLYANANPPNQGVAHFWNFPSGVSEARGIAESCRDLIQAGMNPKEILILISDTRVIWPGLSSELQSAGVPFEPPRAESFLDSPTGRLVMSLVRIVCGPDYYVAHRVLLGLFPGVGIGTCNKICEAVIANNLNYRDVFYQQLPAGAFAGKPLTALQNIRTVCGQLSTWQSSDTVGQKMVDISTIINTFFGQPEIVRWNAYASSFPPGMTLEELRDFLWGDTDEQQASLLETIYQRLSLPVPDVGLLPPRLRVMTMHGAKGLSARVVFIPGLEEETLPGPWRQPYTGLVLEAARLLYVSITRARASCIVSYARTRVVNGQFKNRPPSRFCAQLGGTFIRRANGLTSGEIQQMVQTCAAL